MATEMAVDKPAAPKLDVDEYLTSALSATPAELHPFLSAFKDLHSRKYVVLLMAHGRVLRTEVLQTMASTVAEARRVLRPPAVAAIPRRCIRTLRPRFREQAESA